MFCRLHIILTAVQAQLEKQRILEGMRALREDLQVVHDIICCVSLLVNHAFSLLHGCTDKTLMINRGRTNVNLKATIGAALKNW